MGQLYFESYVDFAKLDRGIEQMDRKLSDLVRDIEGTGSRANRVFDNLGAGLAAYFSAQALSGFTRELINVRGEFQQLEVAFETMLGSKSKADALMGDVVRLAGTTPFSLTEVATGAKQLLAVQVPAEEVEDTLRRIGDISAGLSVPIGQLIKSYGDVKAKTKLTGEEVRQFAGAGVPIIAELAKHFKVAEKEIAKMVETGQVGFPDVQAVIRNLTNEGGMFANLMEKQSKTLTGLVSNLGDAWDRMLNDIGKQSQGSLADGIKTAISLVENYEKVVDVLKIAIATYGAYKAAVIMNTVAQQGLSNAIRGAAVAQQLFNLASKANPVGLAMAGLTAIVGALYAYTKHTEEAATASQEINKSVTEETSKLNYLFEAIKRTSEGTEERKDLIGEVNEKYGKYLDNLLTERSTLEEIEKAQKKATRALMADVAVKESKRRIDEELSDYTETLQKKFSEFSSVISKMSPAVHAEFLQDLNKAIEQQVDVAGDELKTGMLQYSSIAKDIYDKYVSSISQQSGYLKYDYASFQKAFLDVAKVRVEKNKVINELNGYVDAYQQIFDKINQPGEDPVSGVVRRDVEYWEKEKKKAQEALDKLTKDDADFKQNQAKYLSQIEEAEREINTIRGKKDKEKVQSLNDTINEQIEAWERYYSYLEHGYTDMAEKQSQALTGTANTLRDYLIEVEEDLKTKLTLAVPGSAEYKELMDALDNVKAKRTEMSGGRSVLDQYKEKIQQQKEVFREFEEWKAKFGEEKAKEQFQSEMRGFDTYLDYLESELSKFENRGDTTGIAQRSFVSGEKVETESITRKRAKEELAALLQETMTYNQRRLRLEEDYQKNRSILEGMGAKENLAVLEKNHREQVAQLEEKHLKESESYSWMFETFERMNLKALRDYIARLKKEIQAKAWSDEAKLMLSQKLAEAEQKLADSLPEALQEVASVLKDAANLAGELDDKLASALNHAADLVSAVANIAIGIGSGNVFQIVGGSLQALKSLVGFGKDMMKQNAEASEKLLRNIEKMNEALARQAKLIDMLQGEEKMDAYSAALERVNKDLADIEAKMLSAGLKLQNMWKDLEKNGTVAERQLVAQMRALGLLDKEVSDWSEQDWLNLIDASNGRRKENLIALYNQWMELQQAQRDYYLEQAEYATGISFDGFIDEFMEALKAGERSAQDFADNIEDMLRNALIQGFRTEILMKSLEPIYKLFGDMGKDGYTDNEINWLIEVLEKAFETNADLWDRIVKQAENSGIDLLGANDAANSLAGAIKGVTEETASIIAGRLNSMHLTMNESLRIAQRSVLHQAEIAANTRRLENIEHYLRDMKSGGDDNIRTKRAGGF